MYRICSHLNNVQKMHRIWYHGLYVFIVAYRLLLSLVENRFVCRWIEKKFIRCFLFKSTYLKTIFGHESKNEHKEHLEIENTSSTNVFFAIKVVVHHIIITNVFVAKKTAVSIISPPFCIAWIVRYLFTM